MFTSALCTVAVSLLLLASQPAVAEEALWQELKKGGMVVLMRHTSVEQGSGKGNSLIRDASCARERNLSAEGKAEAAQIGQAFNAHAIPLGEVLASPYCRTMDSARLAFGKALASEALSLIEGLPSDAAARNTAAAATLIGSYQGVTNLVMVSHQPNIDALTFEMIEKGEFLVLKPQGGDQFELVGKVRLAHE